jgi:hypothetical protein
MIMLVTALCGRIHFIEHDAEQAAGHIAGLGETTFDYLYFRLPPLDDIDVGVDEVSCGANVDDRRHRGKIDNNVIVLSAKLVDDLLKRRRCENFVRMGQSCGGPSR